MTVWILKLVIPAWPGAPAYILKQTADLNLIVIAENEDEARKKADAHEGQRELLGYKNPWLDKNLSTCSEI
jgi:hypothetical protein